MINTLTRAAKLGTLLVVTTFATAAGAQAPSQAQRDAIKSQCRGDYMAHCSSVPPGGAESLQCLQKNMSSLSASCAGAVKAVQALAAPKAETAPAPAKESAPAAARTEPAPTATTTAKPAQPDSGAESCSDSCAGAAAEQRTDFRDPQRLPLGLSKGLRRRPDRRRAGTAMPAKRTSQSSRPLVDRRSARQLAALPRRRQVVQPPRRRRPPQRRRRLPCSCCGRCGHARNCSWCGRPAAPMSARCAAPLSAGGGRIMQCLASNAASLSPACKDVLTQFAAQ